MTERVLKQYADYCKNDGKKLYHLPFCIWLKYVYRKERANETAD